MGVMFAIRLDKSAPLEGGKYPVTLQVTWDRKKRNKRLGLTASFDQWDFENHEFRKGVHNRTEYNRQLEEDLKRADGIKKDHFEDKPFNYKHFVEYFTRPKQERITVLKYCDKVSKDFIESEQIVSSRDYKIIKSAIEKVAPKDLDFTDINKEWLTKFEKFFHKRGANCFSYMKLIKALYLKAISENIVDVKYMPFKNPYTNPTGYDMAHLKKVKIKRANRRRIKDLSIEELQER